MLTFLLLAASVLKGLNINVISGQLVGYFIIWLSKSHEYGD